MANPRAIYRVYQGTTFLRGEYDAINLEYVRRNGLCLKAVEQTPEAIRYITVQRFTAIEIETLLQTCVKQNGLMLKHISKEYQTPSICITAQIQNKYAEDFILIEMPTTGSRTKRALHV